MRTEREIINKLKEQIKKLEWLNSLTNEKLAQEKEDCTSSCPNVQLMERYEQTLKHILEITEDLDCDSEHDSFAIDEIQRKINEVLDDSIRID